MQRDLPFQPVDPTGLAAVGDGLRAFVTDFRYVEQAAALLGLGGGTVVNGQGQRAAGPSSDTPLRTTPQEEARVPRLALAQADRWSPWANLDIDTPVWVKDDSDGEWVPRHFAGVSQGKATCWAEGLTSHTTKNVVPWNELSLAKPE